MKIKNSHIAWGITGAVLLYLISTLPLIIIATNGLRLSGLPTSVWITAIGETLLDPFSTYSALSFGVVIFNSFLAGSIVTGFLVRRNQSNHSTAAGGLIASVLGAGCASCGSLLLGPLLAGVGGAGIFTLLPGHGLEFLFLSTALLFYSSWSIWKRAWEPATCKV
jgi:hypothetical protein